MGEATRAAVHEAAQKLGYVPNAAARSLRAKRTHILGLLVRDLADPVHGKVAAGFEEAAAGQGYAVFIMTGSHDREREQRALTAFVEHRADGIRGGIVRQRPRRGVGPGPRRARRLRPARLSRARARRGPAARGVLRTDDAAGFVATVEHLVDRGYRRIAYVGPGSEAADTIRAGGDGCGARAYVRAASIRSSMPGPMALVDVDGGREIPLLDPPEALGLLRRQAGAGGPRRAPATSLVVPDEMAVDGLRRDPATHQSWPRLTTVEVPAGRGRPSRGRDADGIPRGRAGCRPPRSCPSHSSSARARRPDLAELPA